MRRIGVKRRWVLMHCLVSFAGRDGVVVNPGRSVVFKVAPH